MERLPGPGEILQLSVFVTEPLFWSLLFDGELQWVWHPAKCHRLTATLEAVIMACWCLATQASASPRCTDIISLSQGGAEMEPLLALWGCCQCPLVVLVIARSQWIFCAVCLHFVLYSITNILALWLIALLETIPNLSLIVYHAAWVTIVMEYGASTVYPVVLCLSVTLHCCM